MDLPYPPSSQNRFFASIKRLPVPSLVMYLAITAGFIAINTVVAWFDGGLPVGEFDGFQLNFQVWLLVVMVAGDYFVADAGATIDRFRPAMEMDDETFAVLRYEYTTVSSRTGWLVIVLAAGLSIWSVSFGRPYQQSGLSAVVLYLTSLYMFWLVLFFMYYLWRLVRRAAALYRRIDRVDFFHLQPLYAFSGLSSRIGIFLVFAAALSYITNFVFTDSPNPVGFAVFGSINLAVAIGVFLYPLYGIHLRLAMAREAVATANDVRLEAAYRELHRRTDARETTGMADLHHEIQAIFEFRREILSTSTWPWNPGTLRAFVSALLLPIVLWLTQQALQRLLTVQG